MSALTTLAAVKAFLSITTTGSDALITTLIARESALIEQWCGRRFPSVLSTSRRLNGTGTFLLTLPESPVVSIDSVAVNGVALAESDGSCYGWLLDGDSALLFVGSRWPMGRQNVTVSWTAGYRESETADIPTGNTPTLTPVTGGSAHTAISVTDEDGVAFALSANAATPGAGEYLFDDGVFSFATADANTSVTMVYDYVPGPVEQACIELVALDMKQRDNIGVSQKTLGGETITYTSKGMTSSAQEMLQPYKRMAPA